MVMGCIWLGFVFYCASIGLFIYRIVSLLKWDFLHIELPLYWNCSCIDFYCISTTSVLDFYFTVTGFVFDYHCIGMVSVLDFYCIVTVSILYFYLGLYTCTGYPVNIKN